jgi:hypothetical protein
MAQPHPDMLSISPEKRPNLRKLPHTEALMLPANVIARAEVAVFNAEIISAGVDPW